MAGKARIYLGSHYRYDNPITICHNIVRQKLKSYLRGPFVSFAGIRLKARQPQIGSHPNVPVNSPLTFDSGPRRTVGVCIYHVAHPGGRNYEVVPVIGSKTQGEHLSNFAPTKLQPKHMTCLNKRFRSNVLNRLFYVGR